MQSTKPTCASSLSLSLFISFWSRTSDPHFVVECISIT
jgi:hypothetical protein